MCPLTRVIISSLILQTTQATHRQAGVEVIDDEDNLRPRSKNTSKACVL